MEEKLYKIKEIADIFGISADTLRIYEKMGILQPTYVDEKTLYRYYGVVTVSQLKFIISLKEMGFSLSEIKRFFNGELNLDKKREQLLQQIDHIKDFLLLYERFVHEQDYKAELKIIPEHYAIVLEACFATWKEIVPAYDRMVDTIITNKLTQKATSAPYAKYLDPQFRLTDIRCELYMEVAFSDNPVVRKIPAEKCISCLHYGSYEALNKATQYLYDYAKKKGYTVTGCPMERYIVGYANKSLSPHFVTEVCLPIKSRRSHSV